MKKAPSNLKTCKSVSYIDKIDSSIQLQRVSWYKFIYLKILGILNFDRIFKMFNQIPFIDVGNSFFKSFKVGNNISKIEQGILYDSNYSIIYVYPSRTSFILRDIEILNEKHKIKEYFFKVFNKKKVPWEFIRQFVFFIRNIKKTDAVICHFAGFSSMLPALLCKLFNKPCFIIVAGNDASNFPSFKYGNYTRKLLKFATSISLKYATHIMPVHESLHFQEYTYYKGGEPAQGYAHFCKSAVKVPFTPVYYGFNADVFQPNLNVERKPMTFLTVGNLSEKYSYRRKGYDLILELAKLRPDINITLVGWDGKRKFDTTENVTLLPFMNQNELITEFSKHRFYFQVSIMEGFPNALAEAMLCGCIPIGSNVSGIPHIIGETGYILKKRDVDQLSLIIDQIKSTSSDELNILSMLSRQKIQSEYTCERRNNEISRLLGQYVRKLAKQK